MVEVKDPVIKDREDDYIADETSFLNFVVSDYSKPGHEPAKWANEEYDNKTNAEIEAIKKKYQEAAKAKQQSIFQGLAESKPEQTKYSLARQNDKAKVVALRTE